MTGGSRVDVLHLLWSGRIGGIERMVEAFVESAPRHRALLLDGAGPIGDALCASGRAERLGMRGGWDVARLPKLATTVRRLRPAVVHAQTHAVVPLMVALAASPRARWIYQEQSPRALGPDRKLDLLYAVLRAARVRWVAPAPAMAEAMRRRLPGATPVAIVPNPCAVALAGENRVDASRPPVVGVVARLEPQKRVDLLLETIRAMLARGIDCRGLVVGGGSQQRALVELRAALGLDGIVELAGPQLDLERFVDRMDVFFASSAAEPYGVAAVAAMARRVPVVAMPCPGGLAELVARGGLLLPDRDVGTAAAALARLLGDAAARDELRRRGERVALETTTRAVLERLRAVYAPEGCRPGAGQ